MTETQQYRVTVPVPFSAEDVAGALSPFTRVRVERIERPVPTVDEQQRKPGFWATHVEDPVTGAITNEDGSPYVAPSPHPPTHEQIAAVIAEAHAIRNAYLNFWGAHSSSDIARVGREPEMPATPTIDALSAALIQNGADR